MVTRGRLVAGLATLGATAIIGSWAVVAMSENGSMDVADSGTPAPSPSAAGVPTPDAEPIRLPLPEAEDGGQVRVVEYGFTPYAQSQDHRVTWGVLLENTSQRTAAGVAVRTDVVDASGESLLSDGPDIRSISIMPGQLAGVGRFPYVTRPAADLVVTLDPRWWPPRNDLRPVAAVDVSDVAPSREDPGWRRGDPLTFQFRVESGYDSMLEAQDVYAIFRDPDGDIVGGLSERIWGRVPPGWSIRLLRVNDGLPEQVDVGRTELYLSGIHLDG